MDALKPMLKRKVIKRVALSELATARQQVARKEPNKGASRGL